MSTENSITIQEEIPTASPIEQALIKANLTETVLAELKALKALKITDISDKKGYEEVYKARQRCKNTRVLAKKICEKGREEAIAEQRRWVAKQNEICEQIEDVEGYLQSEQDRIDNEKQRLKEEAERKEQARIQERVGKLLALGMAFNGVAYSLGGHEINSIQVRDVSDDKFDMFISVVKEEAEQIAAQKELAGVRYVELLHLGFQYTFDDLGTMPEAHYIKMKQEHEIAFMEKEREAERVRVEAIKQAEERKKLEEERRQFQEMKAKQEAELEAEKQRVHKERNDFMSKRRNSRTKQLVELGLNFDGESFIFKKEDIYINFHHTDVLCFEDDRWDKEYVKALEVVTEYNKKAEEKRQQEIKEAEKKAAERAKLEEQERLKKEEEARAERERVAAEIEEQRIAALSDKEKLKELAAQIDAFIAGLVPHELKSKAGRTAQMKAIGMMVEASNLLK